jgi:hypothetical protein
MHIAVYFNLTQYYGWQSLKMIDVSAFVTATKEALKKFQSKKSGSEEPPCNAICLE